MFAKIQRVHFVGIGGIGMSGIAEVLFNLGYRISGSDLADSATLRRLAMPYEIIYVDDGSIDGSREFLRDLAREDSRVKLVEFRRNFGQTAALSAGIDYARGEVVVCQDADLQNDPADIPRLLAKLDEGYDLAIRMMGDERQAIFFVGYADNCYVFNEFV